MAIGRTSTPLVGDLYYLRILTRDKDKNDLIPALFQVTKRENDGKYTVLDKLEDRVSGNIIKIVITKGEYLKKEYKIVKVYLNDPSDGEHGSTYILDLRYSLITRNLFNSLCNLDSFDDVTITLYKAKSKKDNKEYSGISLWQNEKLIKGKFKNEEIPPPYEMKNIKGEIEKRDFSATDDFFEEQLKLVAKLVDDAQKKTDKPKRQKKSKVQEKASEALEAHAEEPEPEYADAATDNNDDII